MKNIDDMYATFSDLHRKIERGVNDVRSGVISKEEATLVLPLFVDITRLSQECSAMLYSSKEVLVNLTK